MSDIPSIGIVGNGFVGGAMARGFSTYDVKVYDKNPARSLHTLEDTVAQDIVFVAVPTPMRNLKNGECDTRILEDVLMRINDLDEYGWRPRKLVVVRSTIPPNFLSEVHANYPNLVLCYMPEFLTERTADLDFIQSRRFIFGFEQWDDTDRCELDNPFAMLKELFEDRFPATQIKGMTWAAASLVKYGTNVFFTTKLSFFNELAEVAQAMGENPSKIIDEVCNDGRIGISHNKVPGHDGDWGWGGHCFPKDNRAFSNFAEELGVEPNMTDAAWDKNMAVRKNYDWEEMKGRAVADDATCECCCNCHKDK
jgi:UDPglucose 6-dehydrogenase